MVSVSITSWQTDAETVEKVTDVIFLGSKITSDGDCSHEIKTLVPWKKSYDKPSQHIKEQRHYFADKGLYNQYFIMIAATVCAILNCGKYQFHTLVKISWYTRELRYSGQAPLIKTTEK